jgi:hypothetical protein
MCSAIASIRSPEPGHGDHPAKPMTKQHLKQHFSPVYHVATRISHFGHRTHTVV